MKRQPLKYNSTEVDLIVKLSTRCNKAGDVFFMVEYGENDYICFKNMSSALDFISTNFKN